MINLLYNKCVKYVPRADIDYYNIYICITNLTSKENYFTEFM